MESDQVRVVNRNSKKKKNKCSEMREPSSCYNFIVVKKIHRC